MTNLHLRTTLQKLDALAWEMEQKWGVGRLPELVPTDIATRFHRARANLNAALDERDDDRVQEKADNLIRAWRKLDELATAAGECPLDPSFFEITVDGLLIAVAPDKRHQAAVARAYPNRFHAIWSCEEIAILVREHSLIHRIKAKWPEASVTRAGKPPTLEGPCDLNDEIPF